MDQRKIKNDIITEGHLDFLQQLYDDGLQLDVDQMADLVKGGRLSLKDTNLEIATENSEEIYNPLIPEGSKSESQRKADSGIVVIDENTEFLDKKRYLKRNKIRIADDESYDKLQESDLFKYNNSVEIHKRDWMPSSVIEHTNDFVLWINSINSGFQNMIPYDKFRKYCQQAQDWLDDDTMITDFKNVEQRREYALSEIMRCKESTLYFLDKYVMLSEGDMTSGTMKYLSKPAHKVIAYMMDCKYSMMIGKGRQMAASSTFMGCALAKILFNKNFKINFVAQDDEKGKAIVDSKLKFAFNALPDWMKPNVNNDRDDMFYFYKKGAKKGDKKGVNSYIKIKAPKVDAINGESPQLAMVDEAGYIGMLGKMLKEQRPTMFVHNKYTGKLEMKRQIVIWGTGGTEEGEVKRKTKAYEVEFYDCVNHWEQRDYAYGIIPIFFDWTARPGITKKFYLQEKRAYTKEGPEKDASMIQFKQHYPSTVQDMFLITGKLLVSADWINGQVDKIRNAKDVMKTKKGYFEPILDRTQPIAEHMSEHTDIPYKIIGANFVPLDEAIDEMARASVEIFVDPEKGWVNRYYQGTDPIMQDVGYSNMSSAIFDAHFNTLAAVVNYRDEDHKYTFLQTMLLGMYYDTANPSKSGSVPELVESNIGTAYINYKESKGLGNSLVYRQELPDYLSGGTSLIGIDNKGNRSRFIITKMIELFVTHGKKMYIMDVFKQLQTFTCTVTAKGAEVWGVSDKRQFQDDVLYAAVFAYICRMAFDHKQPYKLDSDTVTYVTKNKLVRKPDGTLTRVATRVPIRR